MLKELVGKAVLIEWYRAEDDWHHYQVLDYDAPAQWLKVQGLAQVDEDGHEVPFHGGPFWTPLDQIRSLTEHGPGPKRVARAKAKDGKRAAAKGKRAMNGSGKPLVASPRKRKEEPRATR